MKENFSYPIDDDWNIQEITDVVNFFSLIEKAYGSGVDRIELEKAYDRFITIVPNKSEQKRIFREFKSNSGLEAFSAVKQLKSDFKKIRIENI